MNSIPVDTRRRFNVDKTVKRRRVSTGINKQGYILRIQTWMNIFIRMQGDKKDSGKDKFFSSIDILPATEMIGNTHEDLKISFEDTMGEKCPNTEFFSGPYFPVFELEKAAVHKKDTRNTESNYRPVSILCNIPKMHEKYIFP